MAFEREHKFRVEGAFPEVARLEQQYAALGLELLSQGVRDQRDVYYDTPGLTLLRTGVALRQRQFEGWTVATYKGAGTVDGSLHTREELELPYTAPWPAEILAKLEPLRVLGMLEPLVELTTQRQRYHLVKAGRTQAELTFDEVTGTRGERRVAFRELELEALPGTSDADLQTLAPPLEQPGLTPHAEDKLTLALKLLDQSLLDQQ